MLNTFYFENHLGERFTFGTDGVYVEYSDLVDYEWSYESENNVITRLTRGVVKKTLPVHFANVDGSTCRNARNKLFEIAEKDVLAETYGKMHVGEYWLNCYIVGMDNANYHRTESYMQTSLSIVTDDPAWHREVNHEFLPMSDAELSSGFEFMFDFPFDFQRSGQGQKLENDAGFASEFVLTFYGPCDSLSIQIGGHTYAMNCSLQAGERVVIDSQAKTIVWYGVDGSTSNYFRYRYKPESIFEQIAAGDQALTWSGAFGFDLTIIDTRSEPPWHVDEPVAKPVEDETEEETYMMDADGLQFVDADGYLFVPAV